MGSIFALADPEAPVRSTAEAYLQDFFERDLNGLLEHIFQMIRSNDAKTNLMALVYLRHLLHSCRNRFPDIGPVL